MLQRFADALGHGVSGRIDRAYQIERQILVTKRFDFQIVGSGSLQMAPDAPTGYDYSLLRIIGCERFSVEGLLLDGNRRRRVPREAPNHNLVLDRCSDFAVRSLRTVNAACDGIYVASGTPHDPASHPRNFLIEDCVAENCFRQGLSVIQGANGIIRGGAFIGTNGTPPGCGIDLESNPGNPAGSIRSLKIEKVRFERNSGWGLQVVSRSQPRDIDVVDCSFIDNAEGAIRWGGTGGAITRAFMSGHSRKRGMIDVPANATAGNLIIDQPRFQDVGQSRERPLIYIHSASMGGVVVRGLEYDGCDPLIVSRHLDTRIIDTRADCPAGGA